MKQQKNAPAVTVTAVQERLSRIFRELTGTRRVSANTQMCEMWEDPCVEVMTDTPELEAVETEFGVQFDDDTAFELYEKTLGEAAAMLCELIANQAVEEHCPDAIIDNLPPERAKLVLRLLWEDGGRMRTEIVRTLEAIDFLAKREMNP